MTRGIIRGKHVFADAKRDGTVVSYDDAGILHEAGLILEVGDFRALQEANPDVPVVGSSKHAVIPGSTNSHHHNGLTALQLGDYEAPLELWRLQRLGLPNPDPYLDSLYAAMEMIASGVTNVMQNTSGYGGSTEAARKRSEGVLAGYAASGMRVAFSMIYLDRGTMVYFDDEDFLRTVPSEVASPVRTLIDTAYPDLDEYLGLVRDLHARYDGRDRAKVFLSAVGIDRTSDRGLLAIKELATELSTGIHCHLQESPYQREYGKQTWGTTPAEHAYNLGFLGPEVSCAHGVWLSERDLELFAETGAHICHNASCNLRLKSGVAPVMPALAKGANVALGIDSMGINDRHDMLQEFKVALRVHRMPGVNEPYPTPAQILHIATQGGARATLYDDLGILEPGYRADAVLIDMDGFVEPYLSPEIDLLDALIYRARAQDVDAVVIDGRVAYQDGTFTGFDKDEVMRELRDYMGSASTPEQVARLRAIQSIQPYMSQWLSEHQLTLDAPYYQYNKR